MCDASVCAALVDGEGVGMRDGEVDDLEAGREGYQFAPLEFLEAERHAVERNPDRLLGQFDRHGGAVEAEG